MIQQEPLQYLLDFELALHEYISINFPKFFEENPTAEIHLGFEGELGDSNHVTPRHLLANYANKLLCLSGIVTKCMFTLKFNFNTNRFLGDRKDDENYLLLS